MGVGVAVGVCVGVGVSVGVGELVAVTPDARSSRMSFRLPRGLARYVAKKGSLCIDGVSLTVNEVADDTAGVNIRAQYQLMPESLPRQSGALPSNSPRNTTEIRQCTQKNNAGGIFFK